MLPPDQIARLCKIVPPPPGTLDVTGEWVLVSYPTWCARFGVPRYADHMTPDLTCPAWQGGMQTFLERQSGRVTVEHREGEGWSMWETHLLHAVSAVTAAEARAMLVLAVAQTEGK